MIYKKEGSYLGDDISRPYYTLENHPQIKARLLKAIKKTAITDLKELSNWVEDNNHINPDLQFTKEEMLIVLAFFDEWLGNKCLMERILKGDVYFI